MVKKNKFIERTIYLIKRELEEKLPDEDILSDMIDKAKEIINKIY
jgi:hypothetical protein